MLGVYWFVLVVASFHLLVRWIRTKAKNGSEGLIKEKSLRFGNWESFKITAAMILCPWIPNYEVADMLAREFGRSIGIISIPTMKEALLIVTSLSAAKDILSSPRWSNRFRDSYYLFKCTWDKPYGLLFGGGEHWRHVRTLSLRILHQLKFFNSKNLEQLVLQEVEDVREKINAKIKEGNGHETTLSPHQMFEVHTLNVVSQICWSERYNEGDYIMTDVMKATNELNRCFNAGFSVLEIFPWLSNWPSLTFYGKFKRGTDITVKFFQNILDERRQSGDYKLNPLDFTDYFLQEIEKGEHPELINDKNFCVTMRDLVWAGTDTTNSTLEHGILHMALNPKIQKTVQAEIDQVIGQSRPPSYADRTSMPYTQAVLLEILRYATPVPLTSRSCPADTLIGSEFVAKNSLAGVNIYSVHRSAEVWDDPHVFRPERFLGSEGEIVNTDKIIPFGFGKHICIGESVAKVFLFIAFVSLMQHYNFRVSTEHPPPSLKNIPGISRCPIPYYVTVSRRMPLCTK